MPCSVSLTQWSTPPCSAPITPRKSYLSAIASGDYDKANGISDPQVANGKRTLLTNAASKGDKTTISNQRIISATDNADGSRTMRISYTLGGKSMTDILTVAPNGSKFLIFKNWNITTPLVKEISVYASPAITNFTVNGVKVGAKNATASDSAPTPSRCIRARTRWNRSRRSI